MKYLAALLLLISPLFSQNIITPIARDINGVPTSTTVAICTVNPGSATCSSLATTYTTSALSVACSGTGGPLSGTGCTNPGDTDSAGNIIAYASPGLYWCQYSRSVSTPFSIPCVAASVSSGTITGTGATGQVAAWSSTTALSGYTGLTTDASGNLVAASVTSTGTGSFNVVQTSGTGAGLIKHGAGTDNSALCGTAWCEEAGTSIVTGWTEQGPTAANTAAAIKTYPVPSGSPAIGTWAYTPYGDGSVIGCPYAVDTGSVNALAATITGMPLTIKAGLCVRMKVANSSTGAATLNITPAGGSAYGAIAINQRAPGALAALPSSNPLIANSVYTFVYDATNNAWVVEQTANAVSSAGSLNAAHDFVVVSNTTTNAIKGTANLQTDATDSFVAKYNNVSTVGMGVPPIYASINQTSQTAAISTATLCAAATCGNGTASKYHVSWNFWGSGTACSSVTAGSVTFLLTWTDENAVSHAAVALQMMAQTGAATTAVQASFPFQTALANESASGEFEISTNGTIIQYATGYTACTTGTGTYNLRIAVYRII